MASVLHDQPVRELVCDGHVQRMRELEEGYRCETVLDGRLIEVA